MKRSSKDRLFLRLKGAFALVGIVFVLLVLAGGPPETSPVSAELLSPVPLPPAGPSWDF